MNRKAWRSLRENLFFSAEDVARKFGIKKTSAHVFCSRQVKNGQFVRLKKNFYILENRWPYLEHQDFYIIANYLQVPSYLSCTTALAYHGITTQVQQDWYESVSLKRSIKYDVLGVRFHYFKLKKDYYFGFRKIGSFFMAQKEKAFIDACHLFVHNHYAFDLDALDVGRLDIGTLELLMKPFPDRTKTMVKELCGI